MSENHPSVPEASENVSRETLPHVRRRWGYMIGDAFIPLPMPPLLALEKEPPFDVTLPTGKVRRVIEEPQHLIDRGAAR